MLSTEWLNAFAPVGFFREEHAWGPVGAGVFFLKPPFLWLVTANHVVEAAGQDALSVLVTRSSGDAVTVVEVGRTLADHDLAWVRDDGNDLAAAPMAVSPDLQIKAVSRESCLPFQDLVPSMPCFALGCPYGLRGVNPQRATPLVLDGVISGIDPTSRRIFTSVPAFPGNSGGPLIAVRSPFDPGGCLTVGRRTVLFAGVMLQSALISPGAPAFQTPPLHLGVAVPADAVFELLDSPPAQAVVDRIGGKRA